MFTIDASVHINALNSAEAGSSASQAFLARIHKEGLPVYSPTLLLVEVAAAVARAFDSPAQGIALAKALRLIPGQAWIALDESLADEAGALGAELRLRGADAIYAAVARRYKTTLVTTDQQQIQRLSKILDVRQPAEVAISSSR